MRYLLALAALALLCLAAWVSWGGHDGQVDIQGRCGWVGVCLRQVDLQARPTLPVVRSEEALDADRLLRLVRPRPDIRAAGGVTEVQSGMGHATRQALMDDGEAIATPSLAVEEAVGERFTAYLSIYCCKNDPGGAYCGATASGVQVAPGVAAASSHWPFGTRFRIRPDGLHSKEINVQDRGSGVVSPLHLDVWFYDCGDQQDPEEGTGWAWLQEVGATAVVEVME